MSVWIVVYVVFYEDTEILAVCLSEERALAYKYEYIKTVIGAKWGKNEDRDIIIMEKVVIG